jgi:hypothetical protein
MSEHDDDLESVVHEQAEEETDAYPDTPCSDLRKLTGHGDSVWFCHSSPLGGAARLPDASRATPLSA